MSQQYATMRELGRGASGVVNLVRRRADGRLFAAKEISFSDPQEKANVLREVRVMQSLPQHPSILGLEEVIEGRHSITVILEYSAEGTLRDRLYGKQETSADEGEGEDDEPLWAQQGQPPSYPQAQKQQQRGSGNVRRSTQRLPSQQQQGTPLSETEVVRYLTQLVNAIHFLHQHQIVHRDIKLDNLLLFSSGSVLKVSDFGVATIVGRTATGHERLVQTTAGTPHYMAPEVCDGSPYGSQSDVWSLGVVAYEMCMKQLPFEAPNMLALATRICHQPAPSIDGVRFSQRLNTIIRAMLTKNPNTRPNPQQVVGFLQHNRKRRAAGAPDGNDLGGFVVDESVPESSLLCRSTEMPWAANNKPVKQQSSSSTFGGGQWGDERRPAHGAEYSSDGEEPSDFAVWDDRDAVIPQLLRSNSKMGVDDLNDTNRQRQQQQHNYQGPPVAGSSPPPPPPPPTYGRGRGSAEASPLAVNRHPHPYNSNSSPAAAVVSSSASPPPQRQTSVSPGRSTAAAGTTTITDEERRAAFEEARRLARINRDRVQQELHGGGVGMLMQQVPTGLPRKQASPPPPPAAAVPPPPPPTTTTAAATAAMADTLDSPRRLERLAPSFYDEIENQLRLHDDEELPEDELPFALRNQSNPQTNHLGGAADDQHSQGSRGSQQSRKTPQLSNFILELQQEMRQQAELVEKMMQKRRTSTKEDDVVILSGRRSHLDDRREELQRSGLMSSVYETDARLEPALTSSPQLPHPRGAVSAYAGAPPPPRLHSPPPPQCQQPSPPPSEPLVPNASKAGGGASPPPSGGISRAPILSGGGRPSPPPQLIVPPNHSNYQHVQDVAFTVQTALAMARGRPAIIKHPYHNDGPLQTVDSATVKLDDESSFLQTPLYSPAEASPRKPSSSSAPAVPPPPLPPHRKQSEEGDLITMTDLCDGTPRGVNGQTTTHQPTTVSNNNNNNKKNGVDKEESPETTPSLPSARTPRLSSTKPPPPASTTFFPPCAHCAKLMKAKLASSSSNGNQSPVPNSARKSSTSNPASSNKTPQELLMESSTTSSTQGTPGSSSLGSKVRSSVVYCSTCHAPFCLQCHCSVHQLPAPPSAVLQTCATPGGVLTLDVTPYVYPSTHVPTPPVIAVAGSDRRHNVYVLATSTVVPANLSASQKPLETSGPLTGSGGAAGGSTSAAAMTAFEATSSDDEEGKRNNKKKKDKSDAEDSEKTTCCILM